MLKKQAEALVATIRAAYPNQDMPEATASLLVVHLKALDDEVGAEAVNQHIGTSMFLPSVAELVTAEKAAIEGRARGEAPKELVNYAMVTYGMEYGDAVDFTRNRLDLQRELGERERDPSFDLVEWERRWDDPEWTFKMSNPPRHHVAAPKEKPAPTVPVTVPPDVDALAASVTKPF